MDTPYRVLGGLTLAGTEDSTGVTWSLDGPSSSDWWAPSGSTIQVVQKPRSSGAWAGDAYETAAHYVLAGLVSAPNAAAMRDALDRLWSAASIKDTILTVVEDAGSRWATVRREDRPSITMVHPLLAKFSIQLVAPDPRRFGPDVTASTALPSTTGGLTVPFTVPFTISATTVTGQIALTNPGTVNGPVSLRISGPVTGPIVTHVASGRSLVFSSSITLGAGEWLDVDAEAMSVLANGQSSRNGWVTSRGWPLFEPGANTYAFTAASFSAGALLTVTGTPAWE